jgi:membrane protein DedA with SNARE-associated domain
MDLLQTHLGFLAAHPFGVVFWSLLIEAAGIPFPGRVILILTPAFLVSERDIVRLIIVATVGAVLGDHVPYLAGRLVGPPMLGLYCKITLGSARCVEKTIEYFRRFGPAALLLSRFSTSVRIFASACAGCGHITYRRYLALDTVGTVFYTTLWILVGCLIGERAVAFFTTDHRRWLFLGLVALAAITLLGYRVWRRLRYGGAQESEIACVEDCRLGDAPGVTVR